MIAFNGSNSDPAAVARLDPRPKATVEGSDGAENVAHDRTGSSSFSQASAPANHERPERVTKSGEILLSHNHLALLHGLYDRPGGRVTSRVEWIRIATPYFERFSSQISEWPLRRAVKTLNPLWVNEKRCGTRIETTLTDRGRAIIERNVPSRIRGRGRYEGLPPGHYHGNPTGGVVLPGEAIRAAAHFADAFGLPLLEPNPEKRKSGKVFAVSAGLDKPFTIVSREELELRGPRIWHLEWTRDVIQAGCLPSGYRAAFPNSHPADIVLFLQDLCRAEADLRVYADTYAEYRILSRRFVEVWLEQEIDLTETDFDPPMIREYIRNRSLLYRLAVGSTEPERLTWMHPDRGRSIGSVFRRKSGPWRQNEIVATGPAALACLQLYWDEVGAGLEIQPRYLPPGEPCGGGHDHL